MVERDELVIIIGRTHRRVAVLLHVRPRLGLLQQRGSDHIERLCLDNWRE
jgi:hypothetical protein